MSHNPCSWFNKGSKNIWMPYTQMKNLTPPLQVKAANGCYIILEDGSRLLDGISSWWSVCHGYSHPHIVKKIQDQVAQLSHIMFPGLAHEQSYTLASRLANISPQKKMEKVFFSDSGSTAVEVAMKMAVQFYHNMGDTNKCHFVSFNNGYHGDTMGCMSVSDPGNIHGNKFNKYYPSQFRVHLPQNKKELEDFRNIIHSIKDNTAAIILEPVLQAAGGMILHHPSIVKEIYDIAHDNNILFIADEVATGFCRTGSMFACDQAGIVPDIMTIGKALTGGFCTLSATLAIPQVYNAFLSDNIGDAFMHGPTFMGNPLACAAANASLDLFEMEDITQKVSSIETQLKSELEIFKQLKYVVDIRVKGATGIIELENNLINKDHIIKKGVESNIWIRPLGNIIYIMPPFIINKDQISQLVTSIYMILKHNI
ncbi:adenosylmethionine--8-amino-7-oxononanoate transaminase [Ehrlichia ruminantium]|uniref:Adenosylmethionine-8-amino-7-oxononanoate aminotransferase n=1 Tax=Ehrlichia ruminantium TaxID=779 RepID=A0AAE6Q924_EHRRU|nr:adenosylmethionine--8-amino-7-oxononanoate transaminase [Ehrlichia ruminantium]QGR02457.1 adenosylmethionine--8-amino-7-oxononanoate transaminase [Ehrlichia ruminantium]QGR03376.1 adenosylmethionine--8-amino-7-oxononanoate transaminase [Ehrlichia ruminantium]QGR04303.1 adenosylmethionine--8-amino-7-oxononanoate transaminase [Ehrlichia ruminantium]